MKLPFSLLKLAALKGVAARLNPAPFLDKIKAKLKKGKGKGKGESAEGRGEDDFRPSTEDVSLDDLGDLDALDAQAAARQAGEEGDDEGSTEAFADEAETDGGESGEEIDLSDLEDMPDFEDMEAEEEQDGDEQDLAGKKKKLLIVAGGGVALAVLIGAGAWLFVGGEDAPEDQAPTMSGIALNLESLPLADGQGQAGGQPRPAAEKPAQPSAILSPPESEGVMGSPDLPVGEVDRTLSQLGLDIVGEPGVGLVVPSSTKASYSTVPSAQPGEALAAQPIGTLVEQTDLGLLPKIAEDGLTPFEAYARPIPQNQDAAKPKVAIIVTGLGLSRAATEAAITTMPQDVTFALDIYARGLDFWVTMMRDDGHEVLLTLPLESRDFPFVDPGPDTLLVLASPEENVRKLQHLLSRTTGYFGVMTDYGGKFLEAEEQAKTIVAELNRRGLMYVDGGVQGSLGPRAAYELDMPWVMVDINLDAAQGDGDLLGLIGEFEALARKRAIAIARVSPTPLTLARLSAWINGLEAAGFELVPVSALSKRQLLR